MKLTKARLHKLFIYCDDGTFIRKVSVGNSDKKGDRVLGSLRPDGYRKIQVDKTQYLFHRIVFLYHHGVMPVYTDHKDRDRSNNKIENLREVTASQNSRNCGSISTNKSGVKGVIWRPEAKRWVSFIGYGRKYRHLYCGRSKVNAILARKIAEASHV